MYISTGGGGEGEFKTALLDIFDMLPAVFFAFMMAFRLLLLCTYCISSIFSSWIFFLLCLVSTQKYKTIESNSLGLQFFLIFSPWFLHT
jgi:hypothetical protein